MDLITQKDKEILLDICRKFREAVEQNKANTFLFEDFPYGCCRDTSILLNEFLKEQGYEDIRYCAKDRDETSSHAWLEYKDVIIDLTADQFDANFPSVLVKSNKLRDLIHRVDRTQKCGLYIAGSDYFNLDHDLKIIMRDDSSANEYIKYDLP